MKKILILFSAATFIISCGNNNADSTSSGDTTAAAPASGSGKDASGGAAATTASADADKGLELIAKSDCLTCHKVEEKVVGPAYRDVAKKYANTPEMVDSLASKVIHGGAGNWGQLAMTPHPQLSKEDAQTMVKYIMSLKQ